MGINIILSELNLYHDYLLHHGNELYVLNKSYDDIQTLYERLNEINELSIEGMPKLENLNALVGKYVNLEYPLPNGKQVKFLDDKTTYLGNQLESEIVDGLCFGVLANMDFIMICTYESDGKNPELLVYKKR